MKLINSRILFTVILLVPLSSYSQQKISLSEKFRSRSIKVINREISLYGENQEALEMNSNKSDGLGLLKGIEFSSGTIEVELLGENNPGKSFIGIAFNIQNDSTYEVIYFRPFNFIANEQIRKDHMVQYVYHPEYTWRKLREERTGEFEDEITNPPDPDDWFKVRIEINDEKVDVYVNNLIEPVLSVDRLSIIKSKKIGIWTGYGSSGRFKNLILSQ